MNFMWGRKEKSSGEKDKSSGKKDSQKYWSEIDRRRGGVVRGRVRGVAKPGSRERRRIKKLMATRLGKKHVKNSLFPLVHE